MKRAPDCEIIERALQNIRTLVPPTTNPKNTNKPSTIQALTDDQKEKLNKASKECRDQTGVSQETVDKLRTGVYLDQPKAKEQVLCVSKKLGLATEKGEMDLDQLKARLRKVAENDDEVDKIVKKCAVKKETPEQTAFDAFKCLHESKPNFSPAE